MAKDTKSAKAGKAKGKQPEVVENAGGIGQKVAAAKDFYEESLGEMRKVVWPTKQETTATSIAVLVVVVIMSLFLGAADLLLSRLVQAVLS